MKNRGHGFEREQEENRMSSWEKCNYTTISKFKKDLKIINKHTTVSSLLCYNT